MQTAQAAVTSQEPWIDQARADRCAPGSECDFRQLRHHTKNLLQRVMLQLEHADELKRTTQGDRLLADLRRRILLSAAISDVLFGLTRAPGPLADRLRVLGDGTVQMFADATQVIRLDVSVSGACPPPWQQLVMRVAHEFIGNAVKHGMRARVAGSIGVRLESAGDGSTALVVRDDGCGFEGAWEAGDGLQIAGELAAAVGGTIGLHRTRVTVARLDLPAPGAQRGFRGGRAGSGYEITQ